MKYKEATLDTICDTISSYYPEAKLDLVKKAYAFAEGPPEALRYAIDPKWMGEKPRAYRYKPDGSREAISGVIVSF